MTPHRNLIVIWKWDDVENVKPVTVAGESAATLFCVSQKLMPAQLKEVLNQLVQPNSLSVILLHESDEIETSSRLKVVKSAANKFKKQVVRHDLFYKGQHFIYFSTINDTGLIDGNGRLVSQKSRLKDKDGHWSNDFSVLDSNGDILSRYFNTVWDFYTHRARFRIFDLKEQFIVDMTRQQLAQYGHPLPILLGNPDFALLREKYEESFKILTAGVLTEIYKNNPAVNQHYQNLKNFLDNIPLNSENYLRDAARHFRELLSEMPGKIY